MGLRSHFHFYRRGRAVCGRKGGSVNNLCRVSIEEAYNDRPAGKYQRAIAEKTAELLQGRFHPLSKDNFFNFFSADLNDKEFFLLSRALQALRTLDDEAFGQIVKAVLDGFYYRLARLEAEDQIDNATCRQCYDTGCASCFEPEVE